MQKNQMLKVTGILMIVFGAIGIVVGLIALFGALALLAWIGGYALMLLLACVVATAAGAIQLAVGIIGVKNCGKPEKAASCLKAGIVALAVYALSIVLNLINGGNIGVLDIIFVALPILFIVAANQMKQAPAAPIE